MLDLDMRGRTMMLTGFTSGVGRAAALSLAEMGADLYLLCRNAEKGKQILEAIRSRFPDAQLGMGVGDLGNLTDVRRMARDFLDLNGKLDVLFNNAGVVNQRRALSADGFEETFAINHLAHFLLTRLLLDRLRASESPRVISTASGAHKFGGPIDFDDLQAERDYRVFGVYGRSKLANILFTRELARREGGGGLRAHAFHPGFVASDFSKNNGKLARILMTLGAPLARTPAKGAETGVYLCATGGEDAANGGYFYDMQPISPATHLIRPGDAERLWERSVDLTRS